MTPRQSIAPRTKPSLHLTDLSIRIPDGMRTVVGSRTATTRAARRRVLARTTAR
jgi:hypothetical protein